MITREFDLMLYQEGNLLFINANQYDSGEQWIFTLYEENGVKYTPATGAIVGVKSDGKGIINTGTVDEYGRVVINETQQMTAAAGLATFELLIDNDTHGTANFKVDVEPRPSDNADLSDSDLSLIQEAVDAATTIEDLIEGHDPDEVIADAVDDWLDAHPEATTTVEDGAITEAKLNDSVKTGVFEDMTVGTSLAVVNDEGVTDNLAYKFRPTGGDAVRELDEVHGGTIAWNQMVNTGATSVTVQSGHKYLSKVNGVQTIGASTGSAISINDASADNVFDLTAMFGTTVADAIYAMEQSSAGAGVAYFRSLFPNSYYAYNSGELVSVEGLSAHETTGFNQWDEEWEVGWIDASTGQPTANSGRFRAKNFTKVFPSTTYYVFCGNNEENYVYQYDAEQNYLGYNLVRNNTITVRANAHYIKNAVAGATTYNNDICINISDPAKNGTYKPYQKHTYPLDSTLTLRGVPKWSNGLYFDGDIYRHDGSVQRRYGIVDLGSLTWTYVSSSALNFRAQENVGAKPPKDTVIVPNAICPAIPVMDYMSASTWDGITVIFETSAQAGKIWAHNSSYTDAASFKTAMNGVYLVYELATPTTETADPYQQYQICDGKGTEEYVSETVTPVGHNTFYPVDIVAKVNKLPSDFSTLIAPTEEGFKATRNYTVNDLLIVNNVLYKVTANIATGSAITVNTNVQQTTLSALIKALS